MFRGGYLTVGRLRGIPIRLHWSLPVAAFVLSGFALEPVLWAGFFGLVSLHELGHAAVARAAGQRVLSVEVTGLGGLCRWQGQATPTQRALIAWGGVFAQVIVLLAALLARGLFGPPSSRALLQLLDVAIYTNLFLIAFNLLPLQPLDGAEAWPLAGIMRRRLARAWRLRRERRLAWVVKLEARAIEAGLDRRPSREAKKIVADALAEIDKQRGLKRD
jgi:Zn-dependent protease